MPSVFHGPTHLLEREVHVFLGITIAHTALCPLRRECAVNHVPFMGTHTASNGDRVPAIVISASECGQYVSIEYDTQGQHVSQPTAPAHHAIFLGVRAALQVNCPAMQRATDV